MHLRKIFLIGLLVAVVLAPAEARVKPDTSCFGRVSSGIKKDRALIIFPISGGSISGRLLSVSLRDSLLSIYRIDSSGSRQFKFKAGEILKIEYHPRWQFKPRYLLFGAIGFLAGAFIGQQVEKLIDPGYQIKWWPFERRLSYDDGAKFGALGGLMAGIIIPMAIPSKETITCR